MCIYSICIWGLNPNQKFLKNLKKCTRVLTPPTPALPFSVLSQLQKSRKPAPRATFHPLTYRKPLPHPHLRHLAPHKPSPAHTLRHILTSKHKPQATLHPLIPYKANNQATLHPTSLKPLTYLYKTTPPPKAKPQATFSPIPRTFG